MENKPTRAQLMAEQYGKKLEEILGVKFEKREEDVETPELLLKRKKAMEKLASFKNLLG